MAHHAIIFDTETTGIDTPEVIEAAWLPVEDPETMRFGETFSARFRPTKPIALGAMATHHIMDEDLVNCPASSTFALPAETEFLIGHNVDFDWQAIGKPDVKRICTLAIARWLWPTLDSHTLVAVLYHLQRKAARELARNAHSAEQDVVICRIVLGDMLAELIKRGKRFTSWEELWRFSETARIPTVMAFGKHKGTPIKHLPRDYVSWLLRQPDIDPYLRTALTR